MRRPIDSGPWARNIAGDCLVLTSEYRPTVTSRKRFPGARSRSSPSTSHRECVRSPARLFVATILTGRSFARPRSHSSQTPRVRAHLAAFAAGSFLLCGCLDPAEPGNLVPATADEDSRLPQITVDVAGHRRALHVVTLGDRGAPPLLLMHGTYSDARALLPLAERLAVRAHHGGRVVARLRRRGNRCAS